MEYIRKISLMFNEEFKSFIHYLKANKIVCGIIVFMALLTYSFPLTHFSLSIDEEKAIYADSNISLWSGQGRFGIAFLKLIFHYSQTNSVTATYLAVSAISLSTIIWAYVLRTSSVTPDKLKSVDLSGLITAMIFVTFPAYSENIGFSIMSFELGIGWVMVSIATLFITKWAIFKKEKNYLVVGIIFTTFATSIYQAFLPVYVCGVILTLTLYLISTQKRNEVISFREFFVIVLKYIVVAIISFILYKIVDKVVGFFVPPTDYVSNFVAWGKDDPKNIVMNLIAYFKALINGEIIYGSGIILYSLIVIGVILSTYFLKMFKHTNTNNNVLIFVSLLGFISTPFLMSIVLGSPMPVRVNLVIILFVSAVWCLLYTIVEKSVIRKIIIVFIVFMSFHQSQSVSQLFYSDYNRYQEDVKLAHQIGYRILELDVGEEPLQPVVFIGSHSQQQRKNILKQEVLGHSFFEWDGGNPIRISNFFRSLGYDYIAPNEEQRKKALEFANNMPAWPYKGSVALIDDLIVVNLSENEGKYSLDLFTDEDRSYKSEIYNLNLNNPDYYYDMEISIEMNEGLNMSSNNVDPQISFMLEEKLENNSFDHIVFEFESSVEGEMQIFLVQENESYGERFNGFIRIKKGYNKVYSKRQSLMKNIAGIRIDPPDNSVININNVKFVK